MRILSPEPDICPVASALNVTGSVFDYIWDSSDNYYYKERGIVQMTNVKSDADIEL